MIYLDHSATTPVDKDVLDEMLPYFSDNFGNPSSAHQFGMNAMTGVDKARSRVADFLMCKIDEVVFTSGSTESNNLVLKEFINTSNKKAHIITTKIEHSSILNPCSELEKKGVNVTYLPVNKSGVINIEDLRSAIRDNTVLVSVMYVNNEVGSIQAIREIGKIINKINKKRYREWEKNGARKKEKKPEPIYFHTDATQALNFLDCDVRKLHVDFLSLSAHKIYGPKGVGALFVSENVNPIATKSGTLNVPGIVGLGKAVSLITDESRKKNNKHIANLRQRLVNGVQEMMENVSLNTDTEKSVSSHANFSFYGAGGESILISLDLEGIAVSTGSACASRSLQLSHTLKSMGVSDENINSAVRFTLGKYNTKKDIDKTLKILCTIVKRIRAINPL